MIDGKSVIAIVTARSGSKGLPGKNKKILCGKPLLAWPIISGLESEYVDHVFLSTDSLEYAELGRKFGADCSFLRSGALSGDESTSVDVVLDVISKMSELQRNFDIVVLLEPTSPLTQGIDIDKALENLCCRGEMNAESIVGIVREEAAHPNFLIELSQEQFIKPVDKSTSGSSIRRQDISKLYRYEGTLYISYTSALIEKQSFYHDKTIGYIVPKWKSFEVDDFVDFICIEGIMNNLDEFGNE